MTQLIDLATRQNLTLTTKIARGGEGCVWATNRDGFLAKIYCQPTKQKIKKLEVMVTNPPKDKLAHLPHVSYAWPLSIVMDQQGQKVGFLMPEIKLGRQLTEIYNPSLRKTNKLEVNWRFLHATAYNIALFMESIHEAGYVIGDVKPENILVNPQALPSIIDTDSFQVKDKDGTVYRCPVGSEGFTPPELIGKNFTQVDQSAVHDQFRLAVIVFTLLFGYEPFKGVWKGRGDAPEPSDWVRYGYWAYGTNGNVGLADYMIPLDVVHPGLKSLFLRCFNDGLNAPTMRPTATQWKQVLAIASKELHKCNVVDSHFYHREHRSCYWCERKASGSLDVFELNTQVSQQSHSQYNNNSQKKINNPSSNYSQHSSNTKTLLQNSNQPYVPPAQNVTVHQTRSASIVRVLTLLVIGLGAFVVISPMIYYSLPPQLRRIISGKVASDFFNDALRKQNSGDNQGAISDYTEAIRLKPDFANARYNLGLSQQRIGLLNEAMSQFLKASSLYEAQGNTEWYNKSLAKVRELQDQGAGYE